MTLLTCCWYSDCPTHRGFFSIYIRIKGIVHPKMKFLSSFTHPHVVPNHFCKTQEKNKEHERLVSKLALKYPQPNITITHGQ